MSFKVRNVYYDQSSCFKMILSRVVSVFEVISLLRDVGHSASGPWWITGPCTSA